MINNNNFQVSNDHRSYERKQLQIEAWKSPDFNGVWTRDRTIPVRRPNQLSYEATVVLKKSGLQSVSRGREVAGSNPVEVQTFSGFYPQMLKLRS